MKLFRPVDIAAWNLLTENDNVVTYIDAIMQVERPEDNEKKFWFPTPENPGNESELSPIRKPIPRKLQEIAKPAKLEPKENDEARTKFFSMFKWTDSQVNHRRRSRKFRIYNCGIQRHLREI